MKQRQNILHLFELPIQYMGHIFYKKSPRYAGETPNLRADNGIRKTGVFVNSGYNEILEKIDEYSLDAVQLHGEEHPELVRKLKIETEIEVIKAFGVDETFNWDHLKPYIGFTDFFLFDSKSPVYGGTGQTFDWEKLKEYPYDKSYFLSGGLSLGNLQEALSFEDNRLVGLDLNSKFEIEPGLKDIEKLKLALKIIHNE